jgi:hypothetical protein
MKMTNAEIEARCNLLMKVLETDEKYPISFSFAISKNYNMLEMAKKDYVVARNKLLDRYNVKDDSGFPAYLKTEKIDIQEEYFAEWQKSINELRNIEVEINPQRVPLSVLGGINIEPRILYACDFMFEE